MIVNICEAKSKLSALIERAHAGEDIVIARAGRPVVRLMPVGRSAGVRSGVRFGGIEPRELKLASDFHAPSRDEDLLGG